MTYTAQPFALFFSSILHCDTVRIQTRQVKTSSCAAQDDHLACTCFSCKTTDVCKVDHTAVPSNTGSALLSGLL